MSSALQIEPTVYWAIDCWHCGDLGTCLYSYCCPRCALADARHRLDGSDWFVNCMCVSPVALRWMVRTAYNINGTYQSDCCVATCCPFCTINQALQTVNKTGMPLAKEVGRQYNTNERVGFEIRSCNGTIYDCLYTILCNPCARGYALRSTGMPFWFGCCCISSVEMTTILRYHHRIRPCCGDEGIPDCVASSCLSLTVLGSACIPFCYVYGNLVEENVRMRSDDCCYGCDIFSAIGLVCGYCIHCCTCPQPSHGRYLYNDYLPNKDETGPRYV